jgi:hypothetical protein
MLGQEWPREHDHPPFRPELWANRRLTKINRRIAVWLTIRVLSADKARRLQMFVKMSQ